MNLRDRVLVFENMLRKLSRVMLVGHINPDGDCIGSLTGMSAFLKAMGKEVTMVVPTKYAEYLGFLDRQGEIIVAKEQMEKVHAAAESAEIIICMDFNTLARIDEIGQIISKRNLPMVLIDHHPQPADYFSLSFSNPSLSSASELTYWLLKELSEATQIPIPQQSCISLYTGMMTDTNNFSNSVVPSTFRMAAELLERGVDKEYVQNRVMGSFSEGRMRMMGYLLYENMRYFPKLNATLMTVSKRTKERFGFKEGDMEGLVNLGLNIKGVKIAALIAESDEFLRVSLRSKGEISVNALSKAYFNGGGHERASGGRLFFPIDEAEGYFCNALMQYLAEHPYEEII